jgi:osmotically-inducible protein OsmY
MNPSGEDSAVMAKFMAIFPRGNGLFRFAAIAVLLSVAGCASLERCGTAGCPDDRRITADVRTLFDQHPALEAPNLVTVQTVDQVVYLKGLVDTPYQQQLAAYLARQAAGVTRVVNMIGLSGDAR